MTNFAPCIIVKESKKTPLPLQTKNMDIKDIAKSIRTVLKSTFPATKFSVTINRFSQGTSADVSWTDGPTKTQVNDLISVPCTPSQFINTDRVQSMDLAIKAVAAWKVQNPEYAHLVITCKGEEEYYGIELDGFDSDSDVGFCEDSINEFIRSASLPSVNFILANAKKQEKVLTPQPQPSQLDTLEAELAQADEDLAECIETMYELKERKAELQAKIKAVSTPKQNVVNVKLYFDANYVCLGGRGADEWWMHDYSGDYVYSHSVQLAYGFNPVGKTESNLLRVATNT